MLEDADVRGWANELWHRRDQLPPELWRDIARIGRGSDAAGTANLGRWKTAAALWNLTNPQRGTLTARNWPAFYQYFVVEFARFVRESGAVTEFKNRPAQASEFMTEWNHLVENKGAFRPRDKRIRSYGEKVNREFRSRFGETLP